MPLYNEVAHIPLYIWDPRSCICNERRHALSQTIDLAPTLLDYFAELSEPFSFTKGCRLLKYPVSDFLNAVMPKSEFGNVLLHFDPEHNNQEETDDSEKENELISAMRKLMHENDAPPEQYERVGL